MNQELYPYLLQLGDNSLMFGHRLSEWCGHGPALEIDMALTNIALDHIGAARLFYQYAAEIQGNTDEDAIAFLRKEREYRNIKLVEQPKGEFNDTLVTIFYFSHAQQLMYQQLSKCSDERLRNIAIKSLKEVDYHITFADDWMIRLGDGTEESRTRIQKSIDAIWSFAGEFFAPQDYELHYIPHLETLFTEWKKNIEAVCQQANLTLPTSTWYHSGGKKGLHSEHLGFILAEMQYLQRAYPGAKW
jgi:ring-1,2-phenylacetyl-CoA epoxidase subunit PaaC